MLVDAIAHVALALATQWLVDRLTGSRAAGACAAIAWAVAREVTQAEYRWIERFGDGLRANMPWWGGFDLRVWSRMDPWLDWLLPSVAVIAVALWQRRQAG
jgi:hypothetical protein